MVGFLDSSSEAMHTREAIPLLETLGLDPALAEVAREVAGMAEESCRKEAFWLLLALLAHQAQGHTRFPLDGTASGPLQARLPQGEALHRLLQAPGMVALLGPEGSERPLQLGSGWLASHRLARSEASLRHRIAELAARPRLDLAPAQAVLDAPTSLNEQQRAAVALALQAPLALVTGGPGTGKTSIVVAILRALQRIPEPPALDRILLTAPTGKAAQRMGEAIRKGLARIPSPSDLDRALLKQAPDPRTLHRALGYHPGEGRFRQHAGAPLGADVVIVDESSMIGQELMEALLLALPTGARLVLLGDADQLPSVDPGAVFRDLLAGWQDRVVRLTQSYRMDPQDPAGRHIYIQSQRINDPARHLELGQKDGIQPLAPCLPVADLLAREGVVQVAPGPDRPAWMVRFLDAWLGTFLRQGRSGSAWRDRVTRPLVHHWGEWAPGDEAQALDLMRHYDRFRLLCPINEGPELSGVDPLNRHLHTRVLEAAAGRLEGSPRFLAGEPVMVQANDPSRGLFNGDQGVVLPVCREGRHPHLEVFFPRAASLVSFPLAAIQDGLDLCYAMTIHKSQGSEFETLALVLPSCDHPALSREILYTALTRAKKQVFIIGTPEALEAGCQRFLPRVTGLCTRG